MDQLSEFDRTVFKVLAPNDSGESNTAVSASNPTVDEQITAILIAEGKHVVTVQTR